MGQLMGSELIQPFMEYLASTKLCVNRYASVYRANRRIGILKE